MSGWQGIKTAPKDQTRILLGWDKRSAVVCGYWDADRHAAKPRPYWTHDLEYVFGRLSARNEQPTHWMPLPVPPKPEASS